MKITTKGQVTIPQEIRERFGLMPHVEVEFIVKGNVVCLRRKKAIGKQRGKLLLKQMRGKGSLKMSTDEIMSLTRGEHP